MKITVLIENSKRESCHLTAEHGLSLYIEFEGKNYLLDAGGTAAFMENAELLGIDLGAVDTCLLSHGHYDHSGGFCDFFAVNKKARLYAMRSVTGKYYSGSGGRIHYIGLPEALIRELDNRLAGITGVKQIADNLWAVPHTAGGLEEIGASRGLYRKCAEGYMPDDFAHEVSYVFKTDQGLVVINSCSHGGILNILDEVADVFPSEKVYAFLGGLHMKGRKNGQEICTFTPAEIDGLCQGVMERGIQRIYTGHCTGKPGYDLLKQRLGNVLYPMTTGQIIEIEGNE